MSPCARAWLLTVVLFCAATLTGCAAGLPAPNADSARRIAARWPDVAVADLERGRTLYAGRCASCHRLYEPATYGAERWEKQLGEMRVRAGLDAAEERSILQYLVSVSGHPISANRSDPSQPIRTLEF
jgi:mono/diheme cytochrome c family protein